MRIEGPKNLLTASEEEQKEALGEMKEEWGKYIDKSFPDSLLDEFYLSGSLVRDKNGEEVAGIYEEIINDMYEKCRRYALTVAEFKESIGPGMDPDLLSVLSESRKRIHNAMIDSVNIIIRAMKKYEINTDWTESFNLGNSTNRIAYGKFGILLALRKLMREELEKRIEEQKLV